LIFQLRIEITCSVSRGRVHGSEGKVGEESGGITLDPFWGGASKRGGKDNVVLEGDVKQGKVFE
jgi:hypothetical protein